MNRETRTRWYNHKCSKCSAHPFVIIIRIVLYALVRYLRPTLYTGSLPVPIYRDSCLIRVNSRYSVLVGVG